MRYKEELVRELKDYGLKNVEIDRVLDVLRIMYILQGNFQIANLNISPGCSSKIVSYDSNGNKIFSADKEIQMLYNLGIIVKESLSAYAYMCSKRGNKIGCELVDECIQRNKSEIIDLLDKYPNKFIGYILHELGAEDESEAAIPKWYLLDSHFVYNDSEIDKLTREVNVFCEKLGSFNLTELCSVKLSSDGISSHSFSYYVFPPEIIDYIKNYNEEIKLEMDFYTIRDILTNYCGLVEIPKRDEFVKSLSKNENSEIKIQNIIAEAHSYGLTSRYNMKNDKTPFFILNTEEFKKFLNTKIPNPTIDRRSKTSKKWWEFWR